MASVCVCVFFSPFSCARPTVSVIRVSFCSLFFFFLDACHFTVFHTEVCTFTFFFFFILLFIYTLQYPSPSPNHTTPQHHENAVVVVTPAAIQFTSLISLRTFSK